MELFGGKKSITLFYSSHVAVFYIGYLNTARVCWLNREKESSHTNIYNISPVPGIDQYKKRRLRTRIHHFKIGWINKIDHKRSSGIDYSLVIPI